MKGVHPYLYYILCCFHNLWKDIKLRFITIFHHWCGGRSLQVLRVKNLAAGKLSWWKPNHLLWTFSLDFTGGLVLVRDFKAKKTLKWDGYKWSRIHDENPDATGLTWFKRKANDKKPTRNMALVFESTSSLRESMACKMTRIYTYSFHLCFGMIKVLPNGATVPKTHPSPEFGKEIPPNY